MKYINNDNGDGNNYKQQRSLTLLSIPPCPLPDARAQKQAPKFQLSIETEVIRSMESGGYVTPDPVAFKSFTSCEAAMEEDGQDDCDLSIFVVTPSRYVCRCSFRNGSTAKSNYTSFQ